jgi:beta-glucosidase
VNYYEAVSGYEANKSKENLEKQINALLSAMTLKEKIRMIHGRRFFPQVMKNVLLHGSVFYTPFRGGGCKRLGIPEIKFTDGPRGVVCYRSTCLPAAMLRASTFDDGLEYRIGKMIAKEAAAAGANFFAGICINLVRNPRWGRCQETYGEDPCLLGKMGAALTRAVQEEGITACPKHFALNSIEDRRFYADARADERTLREVYLPHFRKCVNAGAMSIMSAYNKVNGEYCAENEPLLTGILRGEWGFEGFVMSDFMWGVHDTEKALGAGLDIEMPFPRDYNSRKIKRLLGHGRLSTMHVDAAVKNILRALIKLTPNIKPEGKAVIGCEEHCRLSREAAAKGMVLLKNNGALPLGKDVKIAVTGPYADVVNTGDKGSSQVKSRYHITPYRGIKRVFGDSALYNGTDVSKALKAAMESGAVVVCAGFDHKTEGEFIMKAGYGAKKKPAGRGGDRERLGLSAEEIKLIKGLKEAGKKVIVCLIAGGAVLTSEWKDSADAILMMYYSGLEGGNALADILCGEVNPGGKLPFTVAKRQQDYPKFMEFADRPYEIDYGYYHGYTLFDKEKTEPEYPFGFGLSYTAFEIKDIKLQQSEGRITVSARVKNTGSVKGSEVVQVYAGSEETGKERPVKLLKGFKRVELKPGEEKQVDIPIETDDLKFYDPENKEWELDKSYNIYVGNDSLEANRNRLRIRF